MYDNSHSPLYIEDVGHGDPIILLHGWGASSYSWRYLVPVLSTQYRTIAIDLKGFGQSAKPYDDNYSIYDQARLVYNLIERLDSHDLTLIGHSYGGGVALATTLFLHDQKSSRVKRLVLIDTVAYKQTMPLFMKLLRTPFLGPISMSLISPEFQTKAILALAYYADNKIPHESVIQYAKPLHTPEGRYAALKTAEQIIPYDISAFSGRYRSITVPVLILWGNDDRIVPVSVGEKLHANLAHSQFHIIDECGHIPHEEKPEIAISRIKAFLEH